MSPIVSLIERKKKDKKDEIHAAENTKDPSKNSVEAQQKEKTHFFAPDPIYSLILQGHFSSTA